MSHARTMILLATCIALGVSGPRAVSAQTASGGTFVAVPAVFPDIDARALLVRERGRDIVLLREEEMTVAALGLALQVLERAVAADPSPRHGQLIPITGFVLTREPGQAVEQRLRAVLRRLESGEVRPVGNLGPGRWVRLR